MVGYSGDLSGYGALIQKYTPDLVTGAVVFHERLYFVKLSPAGLLIAAGKCPRLHWGFFPETVRRMVSLAEKMVDAEGFEPTTR